MWISAPPVDGRLTAVLRSVLSPWGLRGTLLECAWAAARVATYPVGLVHDVRGPETNRQRVDDLAPLQRGLLIGDVEAAGTPILLVPGIVDNHLSFMVLRRRLHQRGFGRVASVNHGWLGKDVRSLAVGLGQRVESLCEETGYERLHIIGHSLGGLIARYYVQQLGGDRRVHTLVTLGSPHQGTGWARAVPHPLVRQLRPGSDILAELDSPAPDCRTRFVAFWSDLDQVISPPRHARLRHADLKVRNVFVRGVGHLSLPVDRRIVQKICSVLANLDHQGDRLNQGVTSVTTEEASARPPAAAQWAKPQVTDG